MPGLCAIADEVSKVHAICVKCGQLASFSHRTVKMNKQVLLGRNSRIRTLVPGVLFTGDKGRPANCKRLINLIQDSMERKKITFDSFIRGVILGVIIIGILMLLKRFKQRSITFLYRLAYCLSGISFGHIFPIQAKIKK